MNILIITFGSRGDVQPYVALGKGLKLSGHDVTICACSRYEDFILSNGINYAYASDELLQLLDTIDGKSIIEDCDNLIGIVKVNFKLFKKTLSITKNMQEDSWKAAYSIKPDVIIYNPKALGAVAIAEKLNIVVIHAAPFPQIVPTSEQPSIGFPDIPLGGWYNKLTYKIVHTIMKMLVGRFLKRWRADSGIPQKICGKDLLHKPNDEPIPILHCYSEVVSPRPNDWPDFSYTTGYWFLDHEENWHPPVELEKFLTDSPPPVYVGFGSMSGKNPERLTNVVIESLAKINLRGIIATGWGGLKAREVPDNILLIEQAPHHWLFPRVAAVVHHGGAGSTAAGLRAGKPTIICPFFGDQPFWGKRVYKIGAGPKPIPQKKLSVENFTNAIHEVMFNADIRKNAEKIGQQIRQEDGIQKAIDIIERIVLNKNDLK